MSLGGWLEFCSNYGIHYKRSGESNIEVKCPLCGMGDQRLKLGLSVTSSKWGCWIDGSHSGTFPQKLIMGFLNCSYDRADQMTEHYFGRHLTSGPKPDRPDRTVCMIPNTFFDFGPKLDLRQLEQQNTFVQYLLNRGLNPSYTINRWQLRWTWIGNYAKRVVVPVVSDGDWCTFTARSILSDGDVKYKACGYSVNRPSDFLLDEDNLSGGNALIITEGPFDAFKISECLIPRVSTSCLFGKKITIRQVKLLQQISRGYERVLIAMDKTAYSDTLGIVDKMSAFVPNAEYFMPEGKDFGETPTHELKKQIVRYLNTKESLR